MLTELPEQSIQLTMCEVSRVERNAPSPTKQSADDGAAAFQARENPWHCVESDPQESRELGRVSLAQQTERHEHGRPGVSSEETRRSFYGHRHLKTTNSGDITTVRGEHGTARGGNVSAARRSTKARLASQLKMGLQVHPVALVQSP